MNPQYFDKIRTGMAEIGTLLNERYRLEEKIARGGMAIVFRAHDTMLERTVAIKVLRERFSREEGFQERFRHEAQAAANLSHPNIVTIHDFGLHAGQLFIVMEHVPGKDLKSILQQRGRYTVEEAIPLVVQICAGVGYAHRAGLVHCDMKPQNIMVTPDQRVKVTDFGIARALASIHPEEHQKVVWGSPQYFSPEQARGRAPSPASDVYGIGVMIYEMVTGQLPFLAPTGEELARLHREAIPIPPRELNPLLPAALEKIILKVLSKEPSARYRTADQLGRVLMTFVDSDEKPAEVHGPLGKTQVQTTPPAPRIPIRPSPPNPQNDDTPLPEPRPLFGIDFGNVVLGLVAILAVGGLIPFWIWVYFVLNPP